MRGAVGILLRPEGCSIAELELHCFGAFARGASRLGGTKHTAVAAYGTDKSQSLDGSAPAGGISYSIRRHHASRCDEYASCMAWPRNRGQIYCYNRDHVTGHMSQMTSPVTEFRPRASRTTSDHVQRDRQSRPEPVLSQTQQCGYGRRGRCRCTQDRVRVHVRRLQTGVANGPNFPPSRSFSPPHDV